MFRLAHVTDLHVRNFAGARLRDFFGKRAIGALNLALIRRSQAPPGVAGGAGGRFAGAGARSSAGERRLGQCLFVIRVARGSKLARAHRRLDREHHGHPWQPRRVCAGGCGQWGFRAALCGPFRVRMCVWSQTSILSRVCAGRSPWCAPIAACPPGIWARGPPGQRPIATARGPAGRARGACAISRAGDPSPAGHASAPGKPQSARPRATGRGAGAVGAELVVHGHDHRDEFAELAGPEGRRIPVVGAGSASYAGATDRRSRYKHLRGLMARVSTWSPTHTTARVGGFREFRRRTHRRPIAS